MKNVPEEKDFTQEELYMRLASSLRTLRVNAGLTQKAVAEHLHITRSAYTYYELGTVAPSVSALYTLCRFYNVSADVFFAPPGNSRSAQALHALFPDTVSLPGTGSIVCHGEDFQAGKTGALQNAPVFRKFL